MKEIIIYGLPQGETRGYMEDILANFAQNWLEDNISEDLYTNMTETGKKFQNKPLFDEKVETLFNEYFQVRKEMFSQQLEKLKITEEN